MLYFLYIHICALYYIFVYTEMEGNESLENLRSLAMQDDDGTKKPLNFRVLDSRNGHQITPVPKFISAHFLRNICLYYCRENAVGRGWLGWKLNPFLGNFLHLIYYLCLAVLGIVLRCFKANDCCLGALS